MKKIFRLIILSSEKAQFLREIEMFNTHTFYDLHKAIQTSVDFNKNQMASFFLLNKNNEKQKELTQLPMDPHTGLYPTQCMSNVSLNDVFRNKNSPIVYTFDLFSERSFTVYLASVSFPRPDDLVPRLLRSYGNPPRQTITGEAFIDSLLETFSEN